MTNLARVFREQVGQGLAIGVSLLDRIMLTAILYRAWGPLQFEAWSVCIALAGLISLFEFGFNLYFNNRITIETEQNRLEDADHTFLVSNTVFVACAASGFLFVYLYFILTDPSGTSGTSTSEMSVTVLCLAAGTALRISMCGSYALYRANREYSRFINIYTAGEIFRIVLLAFVVLLGGRLVAAGVVYLFAIAAIQFALILFDVRTRFARHRFGFGMPRRGEIGEILAKSFGYFAQNLPVQLLTYAPVLILPSLGAAPGLIATFVLLRTLAGLPRALMQSFGVVVGQECGRRIAKKDGVGVFAVLNTAARAFSVMSGLTTGILLGAGLEIVRFWTGDAGLFRLDYVAAAALPMVLAPFSVLAVNVLAASHEPYLAAWGRGAQLIVTALAALVLPIADQGLRLLLALSIGELFGFVPFGYLAVIRLVPETSLGFHTGTILFAALSTVIGYAATLLPLTAVRPNTAGGFALSLIIALACCGFSFPWLGFTQTARGMIINQLKMYLPNTRGSKT